jgi:nitrogen fixation/metabolism regulation signal transduction histidine kinase
MIELDKADYYSEQAFQTASKILYLHTKFWPAVLLALLVIALHSIRTSHKIAGPLYRLNLVFAAMKEGNLPQRIKLRKGDYLLKEAELMNQTLESLHVKVQDIQEAQTCLNEAISECKDVVGHASKDEILQRMNDLEKKGDQLGEKLAFFKIVS